MVVFKVDGVIESPMRGHELGLLVGEYIEEIMVLRRDNLSNKLPLICRKQLRVEGGSWGRIISDGSKLGCVLGQSNRLVAEIKGLVALVY